MQNKLMIARFYVAIVGCMLHAAFNFLGAQPRLSTENLIPKNPQAAQVQRVSEVSINTSRGTPDISFNLYTAKAGNVSIPITLKYDASGIRYDDIPSSVGLKWSLLAGGQISRSINGRPDEAQYFANASTYTQSYFNGLNTYTQDAQDLFKFIAQNSTDVTHDNYSYTISDRSGYFYYNYNTGAFTDIQRPSIYKITPNSYSSLSTISLTDDEGDKYIFGGTYKESTLPNFTGNYLSPNIPSTGVTAWKVNRIESSNGQAADFEYEEYGYYFSKIDNQAFVKKQVPGWSGYQCNCGYSDISESSWTMSYGLHLPTGITTPLEQIDFYYATDNTLGVYQRRLDSITVKDRVTDRISKRF
jgi:hypothetical protein